MLAPATLAAEPRCAAPKINTGLAAIAANSVTPWLMLFATSSPADCGRNASDSDIAVLLPDMRQGTRELSAVFYRRLLGLGRVRAGGFFGGLRLHLLELCHTAKYGFERVVAQLLKKLVG